MLKILTFIGPPGAGKDTQAELLEKKCNNIKYTSMSHILETYIPNFRETSTYKRGDLFDLDTVKRALYSYIDKHFSVQSENILLIITGIPRTKDQGSLLIKEFRNKNFFYIATIELGINLNDSLYRLKGRLVCPKCGRTYHPIFKPPKRPGYCDFDNSKLLPRADDSPEVIKSRYINYQTAIKGIRTILNKNHAFIKVDARIPIQKLHQEILKILFRFGISCI